MKLSPSTFLTVALASGVTFASLAHAADEPSDVLVLTTDTFASTVNAEFYAPWCGHCQALAPHFDSAAAALKADGIKLAKVDCTVEEEVCSQQEVGGYPTLKVFRKGSASEYSGPRKSDGIISYMQKQASPAVSTVTALNLTDFKGKERVVAVAFLSDGESKEKSVFADLAEKHRESHAFGLATDAEAATTAGVTAPALVLYRQFDEPEVIYSGKFDEEELTAFLKAESLPLIDEVGPENFMTYAEAGLPLAYYFTEPEDPTREATIEALKPFAREYKGKINIVWIDAIKFVNHAKGMNLRGEEWPSFVIQDLQGGTKYPIDSLGKDPAKTVGDWLKQYVAGTLSPSIKSEPIPKAQDGPVHILVADEFDQIVFDDKKDVLVEFYAPWCGHCKNLAPIYDQLGEKYAASKDKLVIAKMDATANDVPPSAGFQVQSFPTIKFKPAGSKAFVDYTGDRTLDGFVDFLGLNAKNKVVAKDTANDTGSTESHRVHEEL